MSHLEGAVAVPCHPIRCSGGGGMGEKSQGGPVTGSGYKLGPGEWLRADRTRKRRAFSDWSRENRNGEGHATHGNTWTGEPSGEEIVCSFFSISEATTTCEPLSAPGPARGGDTKAGGAQ